MPMPPSANIRSTVYFPPRSTPCGTGSSVSASSSVGQDSGEGRSRPDIVWAASTAAETAPLDAPSRTPVMIVSSVDDTGCASFTGWVLGKA
jgi:hypothetical protein